MVLANPSGVKQIRNVGRKSISLSPEDLIEVFPLEQGHTLPMLVKARVQGVNLIEWARAERSYLGSLLSQHGGLLFRGFGIQDLPGFELLMRAVSEDLLEYS